MPKQSNRMKAQQASMSRLESRSGSLTLVRWMLKPLDFRAAPQKKCTVVKITVGTNPGSGDIFNNFDVGNVTTFEPGTLPDSTPIYVKVVPYNANGEAVGCAEEVFSTGSCILTPTITWVGVYHVWDEPQNWDLNYFPNICNHVIIPSGIVLVPINSPAWGKTLEVYPGAVLEVPLGCIMTIE